MILLKWTERSLRQAGWTDKHRTDKTHTVENYLDQVFPQTDNLLKMIWIKHSHRWTDKNTDNIENQLD